MTYVERVQQGMRLTILKLLDESTGYDLSAPILRAALADLAHRPSVDALATELAWLAEQGLIKTHSVGSVTVATLTERGADAAHGRANIPGVARPAPDARR